MRKNLYSIVIISILSYQSFGQVKELENFRKEMVTLVNYDNGKPGSLPKSPENTKSLTMNYETAFLDFIMKKESKNLDSLKANSIDNRTSYIIGNNNYFFSNLRKNRYIKSLDNNVNYGITFYGIYDYKLPDFVSIFIQPFILDDSEYVVYYRKLNGKGVYYVKDVKSNLIVFQSEGLTSNAVILKMERIDNKHVLILEDMGDNGERAMVVNTEQKVWKPIDGFNGKSFLVQSDFTKLSEVKMRKYFWFAETKTINSLYAESFLDKYEINFNAESKTISYLRYNKITSEEITISAKWNNGCFNIDDYFIGQDVEHDELPKSEY
ncbi:MAG: hypothetical protein ACKOX3_00500 [Bacteroidota bacterium]